MGIENDKYRNRKIEVHAWQFDKGVPMPVWVASAGLKQEDGRIFFKRGPMQAVMPNPGDWIVRDTFGNVSIFTDDEFKYGFIPDDELSFQQRVAPWMQDCFGPEISADKKERNYRFLEEALELVQAAGCTQAEADALVDYVYGRPQGDINQEAGGVMVTLAAHCLAHGIDMHAAGETELKRITAFEVIEKIRKKHKTKPQSSPLPGKS